MLKLEFSGNYYYSSLGKMGNFLEDASFINVSWKDSPLKRVLYANRDIMWRVVLSFRIKISSLLY